MSTNPTGAHKAADLNHDGKMDAKFTDPFDLDGDGVAESVAGDVNLDGRIDSVYIDTDGDGIQETMILDMNKDGVGDTIYVDSNGDTLPDTPMPFAPQSTTMPVMDGGSAMAMPFDPSASVAPFSTGPSFSSPFDTSSSLSTSSAATDDGPSADDFIETYHEASDVSAVAWNESVESFVHSSDPAYDSYAWNQVSIAMDNAADEAWAAADDSYE